MVVSTWGLDWLILPLGDSAFNSTISFIVLSSQLTHVPQELRVAAIIATVDFVLSFALCSQGSMLAPITSISLRHSNVSHKIFIGKHLDPLRLEPSMA